MEGAGLWSPRATSSPSRWPNVYLKDVPNSRIGLQYLSNGRLALVPNADGNVGIGTSTPGDALEVNAASNAGIRLRNGAGANHFTLRMAGTNVEIYDSANGRALVRGMSGGEVYLVPDAASHVGIRQTAPTAWLHLGAGTAAANTAPLKFTTGPLNTTPEPGAVEFLTDAFYGTIPTGGARKTFAFLESPSLITPSLASPTITGTVNGTPAWASTQARAAGALDRDWSARARDHVEAGEDGTPQTARRRRHGSGASGRLPMYRAVLSPLRRHP